MRRRTDKANIIDAVIFRGGSLERITDDCIEKQICGANRALDSYVLRAVSLNPDAFYCCLKYATNEEATRRAAFLRSLVYDYEFPVHVSRRNDRVYLIKAVEFDE